MTFVRLLLAALLASSAVSCSFHSADLKYPTVTEADEADVQWGLARRKERGGPKQFYQYRASEAAAMGAAPAAAPAARSAGGPAAAEVAAPAAPAPAPAPSVNVPSNLR